MFKNKLNLKIVVACFVVSMMFAGCNHNEILLDEPEEWTDGQNAYIAGFEEIHNNPVARLWKNGSVQNLASSSNIFRSTDNSAVIASEARSIFVLGDDVYVVGYERVVSGDKWTIIGDQVVTNGDEVTLRAKLWKNGEAQQLDSGNLSDEAFSVFVSGNDVYVLGREALQPGPSSPSSWAFKVWKNGKAEIFAEGNSDWQVNSIFVQNNNVYIAGCRTTPSGIQATLWKNGVVEDLIGESSNSRAYSVFISGNDVYVAGSGKYSYVQGNTTLIAPAAQLWKNGKVEKLTNSPENAEAFSVYISDNGDVYVAGYDGDKAQLWKNGIVQDIVDDKDARMYHSVFVKGNDVFLAGYVATIVAGDSPYGYFKAALWKNGKKLNLQIGEENNSRALSVFVK